MREYYILAFDIERSGARNEHRTIAIGASVIDQNFHEHESKLWRNYYRGDTNFEERCLNEFWSKNLDKLKMLEVDTNKSITENEKDIITEFQNFRSRWERIAASENKQFILCCDNSVYDGGFINELIMEHTKDQPIPYSASNGEYSSFWETHSVQKGFLAAVDPEYKSDWGFTQRICNLYNVPERKRLHDHLPHNDAYTIAYDMNVILQIQEGNIRRRENSFFGKILSYFNYFYR